MTVRKTEAKIQIKVPPWGILGIVEYSWPCGINEKSDRSVFETWHSCVLVGILEQVIQLL